VANVPVNKNFYKIFQKKEGFFESMSKIIKSGKNADNNLIHGLGRHHNLLRGNTR